MVDALATAIAAALARRPGTDAGIGRLKGRFAADAPHPSPVFARHEPDPPGPGGHLAEEGPQRVAVQVARVPFVDPVLRRVPPVARALEDDADHHGVGL